MTCRISTGVSAGGSATRRAKCEVPRAERADRRVRRLPGGRQSRRKFRRLRLLDHAAGADRLDRAFEFEYRDSGLFDCRTEYALNPVGLFDAALSSQRARDEARDENAVGSRK